MKTSQKGGCMARGKFKMKRKRRRVLYTK